MGIKITVFSGERIIDGSASTVSTKLPDGRPAFGSDSKNSGHEWDHRCGIEIDLDPSVLSDPEALHRTITGYQKAVTRLMREELVRMGAPPHLIASGNGHHVPAAAIAAPAKPAPVATPAPAPTQAPAVPTARKSPAPWGGGAAPKSAPPARRGKARKEGQPPTTGGELLAWAKSLGTDEDPKFWFVAFAKAQTPKWTTMLKDWDEAMVLEAYNAYLEASEGL